MKQVTIFVMIFCLLAASGWLRAANDSPKKEVKEALNTDIFMGLKLRSIGPAFTSGRIADFAVNQIGRAHV